MSNLKEMFTAGAIALSAVGLPAAAAHAGQPIAPGHGIDLKQADLPQRAVFEPSGALTGCKLPEAATSVEPSTIGFALPLLVAAAGMGAGSVLTQMLRRNEGRAGEVKPEDFISNGIIGAAAFALASPFAPADSVSFTTTVQEVRLMDEPTYRAAKGETVPKFHQTIRIEELMVPLHAPTPSPLQPGDSIRVTFYLDSNRTIVGWAGGAVEANR